jgi:hypothetical protein
MLKGNNGMKQVLLLLVGLMTTQSPSPENTLRVTIKNEGSRQPVAGATVSLKNTDIAAITDTNGRADLTGIPDGEQIVEVRSPARAST